MAILEGLGPKGKMFDELPVGDYLFEVGEPGDKGWVSEVSDQDNPKLTMSFINWRLRVLEPEEFNGKPFFHSTMFYASPEKIAMAKRPYDPQGFFYQFMAAIGAAVKDGNEAVILDDYLTDGEVDLDKTIGLRFHGRVVKQTGKDNKERIQLDSSTVYPD